ncbi:MAG: phosphatase PAP2 family protein [Acidobacteriaceae bacterium]|nr:phosphatase PAP2 family protein [Acidobacteriaceae bacterium]
MHKFEASLLGTLTLALVLNTTSAPCQLLSDKPSDRDVIHIAHLSALPVDASGSDSSAASSDSSQQHGLIVRSIKRGIEDEKEIYSAPFKVSNLKWDALVLASTGGLIAADRHIERQLPNVNYNRYSNLSNITLGSLSGGLVTLWVYGIKTDNPHAKETGELELETLADTFLVYTPMQLLAARERPGVGTNNGRFWRNHSVNTSFPAGHAMFTTAMATVLAHEYPKPWVQVLAYGAAATVTAGRFLGHDHWASDLFVGNVLGYLIARHVFHAHCDPDLSEAC